MADRLPGEEFIEKSLTADSSIEGQRIDKALASLAEVATRSQASRLLSRGLVLLSGVPVKPSHVVKAGDVFQILIPFIPKQTLIPYDFPLQIPFEDEDLLVVDKPAGLVVHPAYGHAQDTLVNALLHHTTNLSQGFDELRPGLVHRLDKDTSGLIVIAKNERAQRALSLQFQRKITHRIYRALVFGLLKPAEGTIRSNLKRHPLDRRRSASVPDGKPAVTHYRTLKKYQAELSLMELKLETGRTHQIRVHLTESGHPIVGDTLYGADKRIKSLKSVSLRKKITDLNRFFLHAFELGFYHPSKGDFVLIRSVWPTDLQPLVVACELPTFGDTYSISRSPRNPGTEYAWPSPPRNTSEDDDDE